MAASIAAKSPLQIWWLAIRPRTLPAAAAPVLVGSALAYFTGRFQPLPALAAFFGALLLGYAVYRALYPEAFRIAGAETEVFYGSVNLLLLLTSSVTMTIAVDASRHGMRRTVIACLALTMLLGAAFLMFKGLEYSADIAKGLLPGAHFPLQPPQTQLFWGLYWVMTGVHAIHLAIGIAISATWRW